jgi:alpha-tubulin suppressor-like RCC1 family protein/dipeptidyl aminopeptidase/acylaminoacyl peptidase
MRRVLSVSLVMFAALQTSCRLDPLTAPLGAQLADASAPRIAFVSSRDGNEEIYVMNADGSAPTRLTNDPASDAQPSWSPDGQRIVFSSTRDGNRAIYVMAADGSGVTRLTTASADDYYPTWSPDGQQIAFTSTRDSNQEIYVMAADGSGQTRLTNVLGVDQGPSWSPDGRQIAFQSTRAGNSAIFVMGADGSAPIRLTEPASDFSPSWAPDGRHIVFTSIRSFNMDVYTMALDGSAQTRLTDAPPNDLDPSWSPDGRQIAFASGRDGNLEIYLMNPDGAAPTRLTNHSATDGDPSFWSAAAPLTGGVLAFVTQPPETVDANVVIAPPVQVAVQDSLGQTISGTWDAITLRLVDNPNGATLLGTTTVRVVDGVATFADVRVDRAGTGYTLVATAPGLPAATSAPFAAVTRATLAFLTEPPATVEGATPISPPIQVAIQDSLGNTVAGATDAVTIAIAANFAGATLTGTTTVQAVNGIATFSDLQLDRRGIGYTLAATAPGLGGATSAPFAVRLTFTTVSTRNYHTCGVTISGAGYCWGQNDWGQLGDGTTIDRAIPVLVTGGLRFSSLRAGQFQTCGLTTSRAVYCWGHNFFGELGDGTTTERAIPAPVAGGLTFASISAGNHHTCGVATSGKAYCWGENFPTGKLGDGTFTNRPVPTPVLGALRFVTVDAGHFHTCGVTTDRVATCWGDNTRGQLGDGTTIDHPVPVPIVSSARFVAVSAGDGSHTCGVTTSGTAYCWGANGRGQLGDGTTTTRSLPQPVAGALLFAAVDGGNEHTCGITTDQVTFCWGGNNFAQLGDGSSTDRWTPTRVVLGLTFVDVSAGLVHSCGLTPSGAVSCWGTNSDGQFGASPAIAGTAGKTPSPADRSRASP